MPHLRPITASHRSMLRVSPGRSSAASHSPNSRTRAGSAIDRWLCSIAASRLSRFPRGSAAVSIAVNSTTS